MLLNNDELEVLLDGLREKICLANIAGNLGAILNSIGWGDLLKYDSTGFESFPNGKIIVFGPSECHQEKLKGVAKELGFSKERFEFHPDYQKLEKYNYRNLQYNPNYSVILFGPVPHKTSGTSNYSSIISSLENTEGFPRVERLWANNALKITKNNFKAKLEELLKLGVVIA